MTENLEQIYKNYGMMGMFNCEKHRKYKTRISFTGCIARQKFAMNNKNKNKAGFDDGCLECETGIEAAETAGVVIERKKVLKNREFVRCCDCGAKLPRTEMVYKSHGIREIKKSYCPGCNKKRTEESYLNKLVRGAA
jgi:hypothetical protein